MNDLQQLLGLGFLVAVCFVVAKLPTTMSLGKRAKPAPKISHHDVVDIAEIKADLERME